MSIGITKITIFVRVKIAMFSVTLVLGVTLKV